MNATLPDLLRLVVVPVFGWVAWRDVRTRRVPNRTWLPLAVFGVLLLAWDAWLVWTDGLVVDPRIIAPTPALFVFQVAFSLGLLVPLAYAFWWMGGFGGADAKALIVLAILFPTYPTYLLADMALPAIRPSLGVFALTILSNAVLVGLAYPVALAVRNALRGHVAKAMVIGRPIPAEQTLEEYGRLLETPEGFTRRGLDLDALRMYLTWRGLSLASLRADPESYRDPASIPGEPNDPGDGSIPPDGVGPFGDTDESTPQSDGGELADPWGADAFFDDIDHSAYGTTPAELREGLDVLAESDTVWITPGIPFLVPMFGGLVVSLLVGDVLLWVLDLVGIAPLS
ncbi:Peptidase A24B FlaK domain protein [Halorhabdus tiamatea SARL4B]|uniref:Peptidase A24B FlaK domain protein n=1 Tax=Halorhabdus tiamatea SARL4B TaxID=1033806 RepID=S6D2P7_9EURY|nr:A24 family peptidase [Halorhabdus tiamatea]ERJ07585.1 Peptidase A24B FlaK domain protein [Halorhabdus tiamatea SARL4B]CCQ33465.1 peptidase A24B, FlaK domain protein [Halorhabdus tiamatea SARL4B]